MRLAEFSTRLLYKKSGENQSADFFYTTVDIPMLMESLTVSVTTHSSSFAQIPFALFSPSSELRILKTSEGGSGDYHVSCRISSSSSDRGGLSGVIEKGRWKLILQKRRFSEDITADVIIDGAPLSAEVNDAKPKRLEKCIISQHPGWYRGELHVHSNHSTGRDSIGKILEVAEKTGLDYIAITDHFTISHWEEDAFSAEISNPSSISAIMTLPSSSIVSDSVFTRPLSAWPLNLSFPSSPFCENEKLSSSALCSLP